jgi:FixJ family two-component response regulator
MLGVVHVVGGDASFQTATGYLLKHAGYEVASYPSAEHLLDHLPSESVRGCILLKVRMAGLSGPDLQERLSELGSALPSYSSLVISIFQPQCGPSRRVRWIF